LDGRNTHRLKSSHGCDGNHPSPSGCRYRVPEGRMGGGARSTVRRRRGRAQIWTCGTGLEGGTSSRIPSSIPSTGRHDREQASRHRTVLPAQRHWLTRDGRHDQTTQIYEGTNQIQRIVISKRLLG
jgi:hypothetical protein